MFVSYELMGKNQLPVTAVPQLWGWAIEEDKQENKIKDLSSSAM